MDVKIPNDVSDKKPLWIDIIFYALSALAVATLFGYGTLMAKVYFQSQHVSELDSKIASTMLGQKEASENAILEYQKKINDYNTIVNQRKISSYVLLAIEQMTLPKVWFSSFDMAGSTNELMLSGQTDSMETLSRQVQVFEAHQEYITRVEVLNSNTQGPGKVDFTISLSLTPSIFTYHGN